MTETVSARSKQPIEVMHKLPSVLLHMIDAVSDSLTSSEMVWGDAMNCDACLSTTPAYEKNNNNLTADNLNVQVFAAMKKA